MCSSDLESKPDKPSVDCLRRADVVSEYTRVVASSEREHDGALDVGFGHGSIQLPHIPVHSVSNEIIVCPTRSSALLKSTCSNGTQER